MSENNLSKSNSRNPNPNPPQSKPEERKDSNPSKEPSKNTNSRPSQFLSGSSPSEFKKKKFNPKDTLEEQLDEQYQVYKKFLEEIYPGNKITKDIYCKIISLIQNQSYHLKTPEEQKQKIDSILKDFFSKEDEIPKFMKLYPDILQFQQTKELEYKNRPEEVKK